MDTFVTLLNASGLWLVLQLGRMSIELTILAGIVLAALYALRVKSPALRHLFWGLLLAKPVATLLVASPLSLYGFLWPPATETMFTRPPLPVVMETLPIDQPKPAVAILEMGPAPEATPPAPPFWRNIDRYGLASLCWVIGAGALGLRLLIGCVYVAFLRSTAITQREGLLASLTAEAGKTLRLRRRVRIATTTVCHGPVLAGIVRPVILLPEEMAGSLSARQLKLVITHELAHAKRWDNLVLLIQRLAEMLLFFHPVVWFCGWMMRREAEAACDDMVVAAYGDGEGAGAAAYADSLTRVAEMRCGITRRLLVNTFAAAESNFHRRIRRILDGHPRRMTLGFALAAISALILIGVLGLPTVASKPEASAPVSDIEIKLAKTGTIVFENTHLTEILDFISASVNPLNFVVDWRVVEKPGEAPGVEVSEPKGGPYTVVTDGMVQSIDVRDKPWREVLQALLEPLGLIFDTQPNYVWISSQAMLDTDAKRPGIPERYPNTQILKRLKSPVALEFENIHLRDLLDFFADSYDINMILDDCVIPPLADGKSTCKRPRYVTDGWVPCLKLRDIPVDEAIEALLRPMDLIPVVQYNFLLITSDRDMELATELDRHEDKTDSTNPSAETTDFTLPNSIVFMNPGESILKTLQGRISIEFEDIHIMDILEFMSDSWDINFALDYRAVRPKSLENSSQHGNQAANDGRMPYINLRSMPMQEALESMFLALDLIGVVKTDHVWVTSKEMMAADAKEPAYILQDPSEEFRQQLNVPIGIEFEGIHVAEILDFIADSWDINFMLDHRVIKSGSGSLGETKTPRYISDGHVPYVNLKNVPILEALVALLRPMNLVPVVKTNHVWVTTYEMLDQITENPGANDSITESSDTASSPLSSASTTLNPAPEWTDDPGEVSSDRADLTKYQIEAMVLTGPVETIEEIVHQWRPVDNVQVLPGDTRVFLASDRDGKQAMLDRLKEYPDLELLSAPRVNVLSSEDMAKLGYLAEEVPVADVGEEGSIRAILKNPAPTEVFEKNIGYYSDSLVAFFRQEKYCSFILNITSHPLTKNGEEESTPDYAGMALAAAVHQTADPGVVDLRLYFNRKTISEPSRRLAFWQPKGPRTSHESPVSLEFPTQLGHSLGLLVEDQAPEHKVLALLTIE